MAIVAAVIIVIAILAQNEHEKKSAVNDPHPSEESTTQPSISSNSFGTETITADEETFETNISYPVTGNDIIDTNIISFVSNARNDFKRNIEGLEIFDETKHGLDVSFNTYIDTEELFSLRFIINTFTGGAHGNQDIVTMNFDRVTGDPITLDDIFNPNTDYLFILSDATYLDLLKQDNEYLDVDSIKQGTVANEENFQAYTLTEGGLVIHFPPYQVGSYVTGIQESLIPWSYLQPDVVEPFSEY